MDPENGIQICPQLGLLDTDIHMEMDSQYDVTPHFLQVIKFTDIKNAPYCWHIQSKSLSS